MKLNRISLLLYGLCKRKVIPNNDRGMDGKLSLGSLWEGVNVFLSLVTCQKYIIYKVFEAK